MKQVHLEWKKNIFSNLFSIHSNSHQVGELRNHKFSQNAMGELNGKKYIFRNKGFFEQHTEIIDTLDNKVIGEIAYSTWMTKATISINKEKIYWEYDDIWNTKWKVFSLEGLQINYSGSSTNGHINSNSNDPLKILIGLYVTNYYWHITLIILIIIFIPILIT